MSKPRPFRFGVQEHTSPSGSAWRERARQVESMGYATLYLPDHFGDQLGSVAALMAAADATSSPRIGSLVFDIDYRHPVVLAREAATLDLLSNGRLDLGLGAGWMESDYRKAGITLDPAGVRIERLEEGLAIVKGLFAGGPLSFSGKHYQIVGLEGAPKPAQKPHPPIVLGGGGKRMLHLAAREADIVNINFVLSAGRVSRELVRTGVASRTDEKLGWIKEAAGPRFDALELSISVFLATVTDDRESIAVTTAAGLGLEPSEILDMPHFLLGTADQMVADLLARRERYGISYVIVPGEAAESLAPVVARLAGR